jgi:hypothetical protein
MAKATRVYSTPPTNTPIDTHRRRFLAIAAGSSIASVGALAAVAKPGGAMETMSAADPIFAAIDAHRQAHAASAAASAEIRRLVDLANQTVGRGISVPSMIEPGTTVEASIWLDIEQAIPSATYPEQHAHYRALLGEHRAAREAITGDTDLIGEEEYADEWDAMGDFADTVPTTLAGLLAMIIYAAECSDKDPDAFTDHSCPLIGNLAMAACGATIKMGNPRQSG